MRKKLIRGKAREWSFTLSVGSSSSAGLKQQARIVEHTHTVLPSAWCAVFFELFYSLPDLKQTTNKPVIYVYRSQVTERRKVVDTLYIGTTSQQIIPFFVWVPACHLVYTVLCRPSPAPLWLLGFQ